MGAPATDVFRAIADPTRREILVSLGERPRTVSEICQGFSMSQPSISAHLEVLRDVGLVHARKDGRRRIYSLEPAPLQEVAQWVGFFESFWKAGLHRLGKALDRQARDGGDDVP